MATDSTAQPAQDNKANELFFYNRWLFAFINHKLKQADIRIDGDRDTDIKVVRKRRYVRRMIKYGVGIDPCALGESYMAGDWLLFLFLN